MTIEQLFVTLLVSAVVPIMLAIMKRRQNNAEADVSVSKSWESYVAELKANNAEYKTNNAELKLRIDELESITEAMQVNMDKQDTLVKKLQAQVAMLEAQLTAMGVIPFTQSYKSQ